VSKRNQGNLYVRQAEDSLIGADLLKHLKNTKAISCTNCGRSEFNRLAGGHNYQIFECRWCGWEFKVKYKILQQLKEKNRVGRDGKV
jgi:ribosomal protein L37AE/L43A